MGWLAKLTLLALVMLPRVAEACPTCAASQDRGLSTLILVGAFMVVPYLVTTTIVVLIRKLHT